MEDVELTAAAQAAPHLPEPCTLPDPPPDRLLAFIDNITFHTVPEPSALLLLSTAIIGLALVRVLAG